MENTNNISETGKISFIEARKNLRDVAIMALPQVAMVVVNELMKIDM